MGRVTPRARAHIDGRTYPFALVTATLALVSLADNTVSAVVPITLATIGKLFHVTPGTLSWVISVQLVSTGVCTPLFSRLGDIRGHRWVLRAAALFAAAGVVLIATAPSFGLLLTGQALQGPAGAIVPLSIGVLRDRADGTRLRRGIAAIVIGQVAGTALGLVAAAPLYLATGSLRDVLWVPAGCALFGAVASFTFVPETLRRAQLRMDWLGALFLSSGIGLLLAGLALGAGSGWTSGSTVGALALGLVLLGVWAAVELKVSDPLFDLRAASRRAVAPLYIANIPLGATGGVTVALVTFPAAPRKLTGFGFGLDITGISLIGVAVTSAIVLGAVTAPRLVKRIGLQPGVYAGCAVGAAGSVAMAVWHDTIWEWVLVASLGGLGLGLIVSTMNMLLTERTDPASTSIALGMQATVRAISGSVAGAGVGALFNRALNAETHYPREWAYVTVWLIAGLASLITLVIVALSRQPAGPPTDPTVLRAN